MRHARALVSALASCVCFAGTCDAANQFLLHELDVRINGVNMVVRVMNPSWAYMAEACGAGHQTSLGNFYPHLHIPALVFPAQALTAQDQVINIVQADIRERWEHAGGMMQASGPYFYHQHAGNEDVTRNCWAHAFGIGTWVQDPTAIYADDYTPCQIAPGTLLPFGPGHVVKITSICANPYSAHDTVASTEEKNRASRIQLRTYYCPGGGYGPYGTATPAYKKKP